MTAREKITLILCEIGKILSGDRKISPYLLDILEEVISDDDDLKPLW